MKGQRVKYAKEMSVTIVSVYLSLRNNKIKVMVNNKCCDNFEYISVMILWLTA